MLNAVKNKTSFIEKVKEITSRDNVEIKTKEELLIIDKLIEENEGTVLEWIKDGIPSYSSITEDQLFEEIDDKLINELKDEQ